MTQLTIDELTKMIDDYGSQLCEWPDDKKQIIQPLLAESEAARALFTADAMIDDILHQQTDIPEKPTGLTDRIMDAIDEDDEA